MEATPRPLLIVFYRNPVRGAVKTRLAATVGDEKALQIFSKLALHTQDIVAEVAVDKNVCYSESIQEGDVWPDHYQKTVQHGADLGERMKDAFARGFRSGYNAICIIGTDCLELTGNIVVEAFESLRHADAVIGPAQDGGYYLLGMRKLYPEVFRNKAWSTETVCRDTIADFERLGLTFVKLPVLCDVDTEEDLPDTWKD